MIVAVDVQMRIGVCVGESVQVDEGICAGEGGKAGDGVLVRAKVDLCVDVGVVVVLRKVGAVGVARTCCSQPSSSDTSATKIAHVQSGLFFVILTSPSAYAER